ncbi:MAG: RNA 2',3'-cyclic phosphodiesterase [Gammaproteobacteria bacterium]
MNRQIKKHLIRAFVAITFPPTVQAQINQVINELQTTLMGYNLSWVKPKNFHITLSFLGEITTPQCSTILHNIYPILHTTSAFTLNFSYLSLFPHPESPIAIALIPSPNSALASLANSIEHIVPHDAIRHEHREFKPHITLVRIKHKVYPENLSEILEHISLPKIEYRVQNIHFLSSKPTAAGSHYSPIATFSLNG